MKVLRKCSFAGLSSLEYSWDQLFFANSPFYTIQRPTSLLITLNFGLRISGPPQSSPLQIEGGESLISQHAKCYRDANNKTLKSHLVGNHDVAFPIIIKMLKPKSRKMEKMITTALSHPKVRTRPLPELDGISPDERPMNSH